MSHRTAPELKSAHQAAFDHYLRTGERLTNEEWLARQEVKFNPYRAKDGRYDFKPGGGSLAPRERAAAVGRRVESARRILKDWVGFDPRQPRPISSPVKNLLAQIVNGEGVGDDVARRHGYASSYDVPFNYGGFATQTKPLTQMNLREIDELQTRILNHPGNAHNASPVGKYQIVRKTLRSLKTKLRLSDDMIFDEKLQDRLGVARLEEAGLNDFINGKISEQSFQRKIAGGWASVADPVTGRVGPGQHLGTTTAQIVPLMEPCERNESPSSLTVAAHKKRDRPPCFSLSSGGQPVRLTSGR